MTKLGEKVPTRVACLPDGGLGGLGVSGAPLQPGYTHHGLVLPGGASGTWEGPKEPMPWIPAKHHIDKI
jgi:hypothetical protein